MTPYEQLLSDRDTLHVMLESARQNGDWDAAQDCAMQLMNTYRKLHLHKLQKAAELKGESV